MAREASPIMSRVARSPLQQRRIPSRICLDVSVSVASFQSAPVAVDETIQDLTSFNQSMREGSYETSLVQKQVGLN